MAMDDKEILDRIDAMVTRFESTVAKHGERLVKVEVRLDAGDKAQASLQRRQTKLDAEQVATKIRIAYIAGAAAVGTVIASRLLDMGIAMAKSAIGDG
jgi:hypothetical protein